MRKAYSIFGVMVLLSINIFGEDLVGVIGGKEVVLHEDRTWEFLNEAAKGSTGVISLSKSEGQGNTLEGKSGKYSISYNSTVWEQAKVTNKSAEFQFVNTTSSGWGMMIYEGVDFGIDVLKVSVLRNAQSVDPAAAFDEVQDCVVNGVPGLLCTYHAVSSGIPFEFMSFLSSTNSGSVQFTFWTIRKAFEKEKPEFLSMISGLEIAP